MLKRPIVNTIIQVIGKGLTVAISLVITGILTRKLGVIVYGNFTYITAIFLLLDAVADFGTRIIGIREVAASEDEKKKKEIFSQIVWLRLLMTLVAFIAGMGLIFGYEGFEGIRIEAVVALLMIWLTSVAGSLEIIFQTELKIEMKVLMDVFFPLSFLIILFLWGGKVNLLWVFGGYLAARIISFGVGIKTIINYELRITNFKKETIKHLWKQSWPMGLYLLIFTAYDRAVDSTIIQHFTGIKEVAWYGLAYKIYTTLLQPAYFFVSSIFPLLSLRNGKRKQLFLISTGILGVGMIIVVPAIYLLAPFIIELLGGQEFGVAIEVLRILLVALVFSYLGHLAGFSLISIGGQKTMFKIGIIGLVVNIVMNLIFIPRIGINGAAWVTVMTEAVGSSLMMWALWKRK